MVRPMVPREKVEFLPTGPGVYFFKDGSGSVLYVGKAQNLRARVRSYFAASQPLPPKLRQMLNRAEDIDFVLTDSEQEAIILECNFIKRYRPKYNVRLKDDKGYPYLKINISEEWPRVYITRKLEDDGSRYFGPFASAGSLRRTYNLIKKLFPFRSCNKSLKKPEPRPCLEYYIHRCAGPCVGAVSRDEYQGIIRQVILFLEGKRESLLRQLRRRMTEAAERLEFEKAAILRDQIQAVERIAQQQKVVTLSRENLDVVALAQEEDLAGVQMFFIREGKLIGQEHFVLEGAQDEAPEQVLASFLKQFYSSGPSVPPEILLSAQLAEEQLLESWLETRRGARVRIRVPRRGRKRELVELAQRNAQEALEQLKLKRLVEAGRASRALEELKVWLGLPELPHRIECYDISDIRGKAAVGSLVVFEEGQPKPAFYRRFRIKNVSGMDDYAMMREVLRRRFGRLKQGEEGWSRIPQLVLIDGGRGHLNLALEVMRELNLESIPVAAIAKEQEEIFLPKRPEGLLLPRNSQGLYLLQRIRDEAHRFALSYHLKVREKQGLKSGLDLVPGIGPKRKRLLLRRFGSLEAIREASVEDLAAVPGMTRHLAEKVKEYL